MPIKPENAHRYPATWKAIRAQVLERAQQRCEWPGCGVANHVIGYWDGERFVVLGRTVDEAGLACDSAELDGHHVIRIVLTVAHLDHVPEHCELHNLRAWCQRHHLRYDIAHHRQTAYMTRRARAATAEMF